MAAAGSEAASAERTPCRMVYLDIGSNIGDSLASFARGQPEFRLRETLKVAMGTSWSPATTCAYAFEPSPRWTTKLREVRARLAPHFSSLTIHTDTAVGGPEQLAQPLWLIQHGVRGIGSVLSTTRPVDNQQNATPVTTFRLVAWLRDVVAKQHGWQTPVVMRMDVEGTEYDILSDLATSGIGRRMPLYVTVEWHRHVRANMLGSRERQHMAMLDDAFFRYPYRCGDGSCSGAMSEVRRKANSTIEGNLEKTLAYMLHRAGITFVDGLDRKPQDPAFWNATQHRKVQLQGLED